MPAGSSPLAGSSRIRTRGSPSSAWAMPESLAHAEGVVPHPALGLGRRQRDQLEHLVDAATAAAPWSRRRCVSTSRPVRPACCAEASSRTPTSRPGFGRSRVPVPADGDAPLAGGREADHDAHRGRLPGAVRPQEASDPTRAGGERHVVDRREAAVALGDSVNSDHDPTLSRTPAARHRSEASTSRPKKGVGRVFGICLPVRGGSLVLRSVHDARRPEQYNPPLTWWAHTVAHGVRAGVQRGVLAVSAELQWQQARALFWLDLVRCGLVGAGAVVLPATLAVRRRAAHQRLGTVSVTAAGPAPSPPSRWPPAGWSGRSRLVGWSASCRGLVPLVQPGRETARCGSTSPSASLATLRHAGVGHVPRLPARAAVDPARPGRAGRGRAGAARRAGTAQRARPDRPRDARRAGPPDQPDHHARRARSPTAPTSPRTRCARPRR